MDITATYQKILREILLGQRGLQRLSSEDLEELNQQLNNSYTKKDYSEMQKLLCIVEHSASLSNKFEEGLLLLLNSNLPVTHIVFALNCARKHIIEARFQKAQRLSFEFLETLKNLLYHKNPEVVEWTLRQIEGCGNQGVYFLKEFDKIKPPPWKWFNSHQRAVREIITLLERRWSPSENPQS